MLLWHLQSPERPNLTWRMPNGVLMRFDVRIGGIVEATFSFIPGPCGCGCCESGFFTIAGADSTPRPSYGIDGGRGGFLVSLVR